MRIPQADKKEAVLDAFFLALSEAPRAFLFLDYDGTLAPFRVDRFKARPWAGVRDLLVQIQKGGRSRMQVITGRPAGEIAPLLELDPPLDVWGLHGAERLYANGQRVLEEAAPETRAKLDKLRNHLQRDSLGGLFEDKANAVVMHWRGESAEKARLIEHRARALFEPTAQMRGLMLLEFEAGLELRAGRDKGGALRASLAEARSEGFDGPVAFLGDDLTDESAFVAVNAHNAAHLSVLVRRELRKTAADVWLEPPEAVREFLRRWVKAMEGGSRIKTADLGSV